MPATVSPQRRMVRWLLLAGCVAACIWIVWQARSLIVPCVLAAFLAYVCVPAVDFMELHRVPRVLGVALLALAASIALIGAALVLRSVAPTAEGIVEFKVRAIHAISTRYAQLMELDDDSPSGNHFHRLVGRESDPAVVKAVHLLALTPEEDRLLLARSSMEAKWSRLRDQYMRDQAWLARNGDTLRPPHPAAGESDAWLGSFLPPVGALAQQVPVWITAVLLFVFMLLDKGEMKRAIVACVPNRYFEPVLAIHVDLHAALQRYAKALVMQCLLLGLTVAAMLTLAGIPFRWAAVIGFLAGMANVVPYAGIATAYAGAMLYALLGYETRPFIPFVDDGNFPWVVLGAVLVTDAIKNAVYDPVVFGGALQLHPVAVILGVAVGGAAFGFVGALFAVPAIAFGRTLGVSVFRQLRAYGEI